MKVIFLDKDGVLNSDEFFDRNDNLDDDWSKIDVDFEKVNLLKQAVNMTGAMVVVTASARYTKGGQKLIQLLREQQIMTEITPLINNERGVEIKDWLSKHPETEDFVILDDEIFDSYDEYLMQKLIKISNGNGISFGEGLLQKDIDEIIQKLGRKRQKTVYDGEFELISTDKLDEFNQEFIRYTKERYDIYKKIFGVENFRKLSFVIFDNLDDYRDDYVSRNKSEPPSYSRGNFSYSGAYICVDQQPIPGSRFFNKKQASGAHEAFHIFYRELVYGKNNERRIVWFDEGMAQYLSGQNDSMSEESFRKYYSRFKRNYKPITNLNERVQGNLQVSDDMIFSREGVIDGYSLSYLAIRYLAETKGLDYLKELMLDNQKILEIGENVIEELTTYYDEKLANREEER